MSIKKQYLKNKPVCKVTFTLPRDRASEAQNVALMGDFNDWNPGTTPMKRRRDGSFEATLNLDTGHEYQFRYLLNNNTWENDDSADKYVRSPYGDTENSVIAV
ncbi:MAG TPA: isoamylase early set domain-containing protein [Deltaproteobacteria bacterium]|jgi:1,4-alpha-glucan branching enzyme|nr:isoamylase early set domain-containing protein [Deltaproteobacteria bacterium]HOI07539.1 isoamylase early set domain-containing protein [Deltaproteobacteria bacterium]